MKRTKSRRKIKNCFLIEHRREVMRLSAQMWREHFEEWFENALYPALPVVFKMIGIFVGSLFVTLALWIHINGI